MKFQLMISFALLTGFTATAFALTEDRDVTPKYVRENSEKFSVKVNRGKEGLVEFTIMHNVAEPLYHVAHLAVYHQGKLLSTSDTPCFGRKGDNTFHFSLRAEDIVESKFELSDSSFGVSGETAVPLPGTTNYRFALQAFVPAELESK
jgi:hypothetical protein